MTESIDITVRLVIHIFITLYNIIFNQQQVALHHLHQIIVGACGLWFKSAGSPAEIKTTFYKES
jgi:hypothetical protein